jgi:hypothetical protein
MKVPGRSVAICSARSPTWVLRVREREPLRYPRRSSVRSWQSAPRKAATSSSISYRKKCRASSAISSPALLPLSSEALQVRQSDWWAWFVWLRWYSNKENGPAYPLQRQPLGQPPEVRGPPRLRRGWDTGGMT